MALSNPLFIQMASEKDRYPLPSWIGRAPKGSHLDVLKSDKLIQKLIVDEKGYYYFGRNPSDCDFVCEHASCSRVHAVLLFHKLLKRFAVVDLDSSHGTFVDNVRIPALSPQFLDPNQCFHFGASTRKYYLGEKVTASHDDLDNEVETESGFSQVQTDLDNQTELNTANNRRIPKIPQTMEEARRKLRHRPKVKFTDEEEIINPEEVDPTVGRFRNMVRTAIIPVSSTHRRQRDKEDQLFDFYAPAQPKKKKISSPATVSSNNDAARSASDRFTSITLGSLNLNAAPDLDLYTPALPPPKSIPSAAAVPPSKYGPSLPLHSTSLLLGVGSGSVSGPVSADSDECPSKKKYAKEAWPADMRRRSGVL